MSVIILAHTSPHTQTLQVETLTVCPGKVIRPYGTAGKRTEQQHVFAKGKAKLFSSQAFGRFRAIFSQHQGDGSLEKKVILTVEQMHFYHFNCSR